MNTIAGMYQLHDGGGIYLDDHSNLTLHSQNTLRILENWATENGGGIYLSHSDLTIYTVRAHYKFLKTGQQRMEEGFMLAGCRLST